jgi:TonB-dependent SusC/RagA subfamily outer membrane receptor
MKRKFIYSPGFKKPIMLLLTVLCCLKICAQQTVHVSGVVTAAEDGRTLPGVSVRVKNANTGIATDANGKYTLTVSKNAVLVFSFIGYTPVERDVTGTAINVQLSAGQGSLAEVVVVGYGSSSKTNLATATSSVSAKEIKSAVITTIDQALQGRASGVQVTTASGEPGADAVIRIRGNNSLNGNNQPLYVVDGFPMPPYVEASANSYGASSQNGLYGINPNDIESLEVLKDAAATAIYGSRGANGVILIKTKSGRRGDQKIEFVNKTTFVLPATRTK